MRTIRIILFLFPVLMGRVEAQTGLGVAGTLNYPGLSASDQYHSRFGPGGGYEFFARHQLLKINPSVIFHARYNYRRYFNDINLPFTATTRFNFTYLSITILYNIKRYSSINLYTAAGADLVTINAARDYLKVTEVAIMPEIAAGGEWYVSADYNLFAEISFQVGSVAVRTDTIPLTGFRFSIGATMFFISED